VDAAKAQPSGKNGHDDEDESPIQHFRSPQIAGDRRWPVDLVRRAMVSWRAIPCFTQRLA